MRYRKLTASGDMTFGHSQNDFYIDQPEAVAQAVKTRLGMYTGDWYLSLTDGTLWRIQVFGKYTDLQRDPCLIARIQGTTGLLDISSFNSQLNRDTRSYSVQTTIDTIYGSIPLNGVVVPAPPQTDVRISR